jgi:heme A synthase
MEQRGSIDPALFASAMGLIRRRRKYFFVTIVAYMPAMWLTNEISPAFRSMAFTFCAWVVILFVTGILSAVVRCPRCGQYFHMHGMSLLYLRRCLHCQLHVNADKTG